MKVFLLALIMVIALAMFINSAMRPQEPSKSALQSHAEEQWHGLPNYIEKPEAARAHATVLARRTGGDFRRLSAEERRWLDAMTAGHGAQMLRGEARALKAKEAAEKKRAQQKKPTAGRE